MGTWSWFITRGVAQEPTASIGLRRPDVTKKPKPTADATVARVVACISRFTSLKPRLSLRAIRHFGELALSRKAKVRINEGRPGGEPL